MEYAYQAARIASKLNPAPVMSRFPPPQTSPEYSPYLADLATRIFYCSPLPSQKGLPLFVLNASAFPDAKEVDYNRLLPYVLARLPADEELIDGNGYEIIFFAGGDSGITGSRKSRPGWGWFFQAYHLLTRAARKRLRTLVIVHESSFVRILVEMFSTIISPKFRKKIVHASTLSVLALYLPVEDILIPPSAYIHDRKLAPDIHAPYASGRRAFGVRRSYSFPTMPSGDYRLPRVLRETGMFLSQPENLQTEGLFRVSASTQTLHILAEAYDRGQKFIVWKDDNVYLPFQDTIGQRFDPLFVEEADLDGYGVHVAAGLIKLWYRELFRPLIPTDSYPEIERLCSEEKLSIDDLAALLSPGSIHTPLPLNSRIIFTAHLLPVLALVASYADMNKMTSSNLAVCFAPTLTRGENPLEEVRIANTVTKLLGTAIDLWNFGLREAIGQPKEQFRKLILPPLDGDHYEDPFDEPGTDTIPIVSELSPQMQHRDIWEAYSPMIPPVSKTSTSLSSVERKPLPEIPTENQAPRPGPTNPAAKQAIKRRSLLPQNPYLENFIWEEAEPVKEEEEPSSPDVDTRSHIPILVESTPAEEDKSDTSAIDTPPSSSHSAENVSLVPGNSILRKHVPAKSLGVMSELQVSPSKHVARKSYDDRVNTVLDGAPAPIFDIQRKEIQKSQLSSDAVDSLGISLPEGAAPADHTMRIEANDDEISQKLTEAIIDDNQPAFSESNRQIPEQSEPALLVEPVQPASINDSRTEPEPVVGEAQKSENIAHDIAHETPVATASKYEDSLQPTSVLEMEKSPQEPQNLLNIAIPASDFAENNRASIATFVTVESSNAPSLTDTRRTSMSDRTSTPPISPALLPSPYLGSTSFSRRSSFSPASPSSPPTAKAAGQSPSFPLGSSRTDARDIVSLSRTIKPQTGSTTRVTSDGKDIVSLSRTIKPQAALYTYGAPILPRSATSSDVVDSPVLIRRGTNKLGVQGISRKPTGSSTTGEKGKEVHKLDLKARGFDGLKRIYEERAESQKALAEVSKASASASAPANAAAEGAGTENTS
jgi:hypothetical protein